MISCDDLASLLDYLRRRREESTNFFVDTFHILRHLPCCSYGVVYYQRQYYELFLIGDGFDGIPNGGELPVSILDKSTMRVYTHKNYRERGYGSQLLLTAIRQCQDWGEEVCVYHSIPSFNKICDDLGLLLWEGEMYRWNPPPGLFD